MTDAEIDDLIALLPRCDCGSPMIDKNDVVAECVSCGHWSTWDETIENAHAVMREARAEYPLGQLEHRIARRVLSGHERARELYRAARRPLPQWLLRCRPLWAPRKRKAVSR